MTTDRIDPARAALLLVDMQNDFLHPDGAYARGGATLPGAERLIANLAGLAATVRVAGGWIVATQFTLVPGRGGEPMISPHLKRLRPFLRRGDFASGGFGHALIDPLAPADLSIEKIAYSAFYMTRLEFVLRKAGVETLLIGGIVTNGGVASTLRDAHVRDFATILLSDGCAAFTPEAHRSSLASLGTISPLRDCAAAASQLCR